MTTKLQKRNNPNGANQWHPDPRQQLFIAYYKDPKSPTFSSARGSAIRAGYTEQYADNIMSNLPDWLLEVVGTVSPLLARAEKNLKEFLELPNETHAMGAFGPVYQKVTKQIPNGFYKNGKPKFKSTSEKVAVMTLNPSVMKIKQATSHFVAETVGKKIYSKQAGDASNVYNILIFANEQRARIAKRVIRGGSAGNPDGQGASD